MEKILAVKPTSNFGGICILEIIHDLDDYVVSAEDYGDGLIRKAKARVRYSMNCRPYFMRQGRREYLDEYIKQ